DRQIVDAREAPSHEALLGEFPVLVAVAAEPVARVVVPFVGEAHGNAVTGAGPELLDEPIVELLRPLALQEGPHLLAAPGKLAAVAPLRVLGIDLHDAVRVAGIPGVLCATDLLRGGLDRERGNGWTGLHADLPNAYQMPPSATVIASPLTPPAASLHRKA